MYVYRNFGLRIESIVRTVADGILYNALSLITRIVQ